MTAPALPAGLPHLLSPRDIAARWGCKVDKVLAEIHAARLPALNIGRGVIKARYRIDPADLERYESNRRVQPPAKRGRPRKQPARPAGWTVYFQ